MFSARFCIADTTYQRKDEDCWNRVVRGNWGGIARDSRQSSRFSGLCAPVRHGVTCRRITATEAIRTVVWCDKGVWEQLLEILIDKPDDEWLMIDVSHGKVHASGARGGKQEMSCTKVGSTQNASGRAQRAYCLLHKVQEQVVKRQTA